MKRVLESCLIAALLLGGVGCTGTEDDDDSSTPSEETPALDTIVGDWVSEGDNVADLLQMDPLFYTRIEASFSEDLTYEVVATDTSDVETTFTGTYTVSESGVEGIMNITLYQASPSTLTSEGIYQIDISTDPQEMTYEVVQTDPSIGVTPPTAEAGFGSSGDGAFLDYLVQVYTRI